jgi:hypothetical protein
LAEPALRLDILERVGRHETAAIEAVVVLLGKKDALALEIDDADHRLGGFLCFLARDIAGFAQGLPELLGLEDDRPTLEP